MNGAALPIDKTARADREVYSMSNPHDTLAEAAELLTTEAEVLKICHTHDGDWGDDQEAKKTYDRMTRVASELREMERQAC